MSGLLASLETPITHLRTNKRFTIRFHCDVYRYFHPRHAAPLAENEESSRRDFSRRNSRKPVCWRPEACQRYATRVDMGLSNKEYPR